jgi:hypothetical protein
MLFVKGIKLIFDMSPILLIQKVFYVSIATTNILVNHDAVWIQHYSSAFFPASPVKSCKCHHQYQCGTTIITHVADTYQNSWQYHGHHSTNVFNFRHRLMRQPTGAAMEIHAPHRHHRNCSFGRSNQAWHRCRQILVDIQSCLNPIDLSS